MKEVVKTTAKKEVNLDELIIDKNKIYISDWGSSLGLLTTHGNDGKFIFTCFQGIECGTNGTYISPKEAISATINSGKHVYEFDDLHDFSKWMKTRF